MMVVTVRVPTTSAADLSITVVGNDVRMLGSDGFRHDVTMAEADLERLHAQLYRGILELRAPHAVRAVAVDVIG
jgi:hypothetical protein